MGSHSASGDSYQWERKDLCYRDDVLTLAGQDAEGIAPSAGAPVFLCRARRVRQNLERWQDALAHTDLGYSVFYAMKANRFPPLLTCLRVSNCCGVDVCSPEEFLLAREIGFEETKISWTGTSVSEEDLSVLQRPQGVVINCASLSSIRRLRHRCPGQRIGLSI